MIFIVCNIYYYLNYFYSHYVIEIIILLRQSHAKILNVFAAKRESLRTPNYASNVESSLCVMLRLLAIVRD